MYEPPLPHLRTEIPNSKTPHKLTIWEGIGIVILSLICVPIIGVIVMMNVGLFWIKPQPLPPLPARHVGYHVVDSGKTTFGVLNNSYPDTRDLYISRTSPDGSGTQIVSYRLSANGSVQELIGSAGDSDRLAREANRSMAAKQWGIEQKEYGDRVLDVTRTGKVGIIRKNGQIQMYRNGKVGAVVPHQVRGYDWKQHCHSRFFAVNDAGDAIGNEWLATACASSGGTSEPHGRLLPLIWHGDQKLPEDLNTLIPATDGWYLYYALDINDRGQILCLAEKATVRNAESPSKILNVVVLDTLVR